MMINAIQRLVMVCTVSAFAWLGLLASQAAASDALAGAGGARVLAPSGDRGPASRELLLPPGFSQAQVLDEGKVAGQRIRLWQVRAAIGADQALAQVAEIWRSRPDAHVLEYRQPGWLILSRIADGRLDMLQLRPDARQTEGFLSTWRAGQGGDHVSITHLIPRGFRAGRPLQVAEGVRQVSSAVAEADEPIASARQRLDRHLRALGFVPATLPDDAGEVSIMRYVAPERELTVLVRGQDRRSRFVFTLSEAQP